MMRGWWCDDAGAVMRWCVGGGVILHGVHEEGAERKVTIETWSAIFLKGVRAKIQCLLLVFSIKFYKYFVKQIPKIDAKTRM